MVIGQCYTAHSIPLLSLVMLNRLVGAMGWEIRIDGKSINFYQIEELSQTFFSNLFFLYNSHIHIKVDISP